MTDTVLMRTYREGDEEEINHHFNQVFNKQRTLDEWRWKFKDHPLSEINLISLAEVNGKIVGHYASHPWQAKYKGRDLKLSSVVDNYVLPEFRGGFKGVQWEIFKQVCELNKAAGISYGIGFPNREHYVIGKRVLKYNDFGTIPVLFKRLSWRLAIQSRFPWLPHMILDAICFFPRFFHKQALEIGGAIRAESSQVREVDSFDERFDAFWDKIGAQYQIVGVRNQEYLEWRYRKPGANYKILVSEINGELVGYLVLSVVEEEGERIGNIVDFLADERVETGSTLIKHALLRFLAERVDYVRCWMTEDKQVYRTLGRYGFIRRGDKQPVKGVFLIFDETLDPDFEFIGDIRNWYITMGDSDAF